MKKEIADFFRICGSVLSIYLILIFGYGLFLHLAGLSDKLGLSFLGTVTIFLIGPLSIFFVTPAFVLSLNWSEKNSLKIICATVNALGIACSLASAYGAFMLFKIGPLNLQ